MDLQEQLTHDLRSMTGGMNFDASFERHFNAIAPKLGAVMAKHIKTHTNPHGMSTGGALSHLAGTAKGILSINTNRQTHTIGASLPFVLFGQKQQNSGYLSIIKQFQPVWAGHVVTLGGNLNGVATAPVSVDPATGDVLFNWIGDPGASGAVTDIIRVHLSGALDYNSFNQGLSSTSYFKTKGALYTFSDSGIQVQEDEPINLGKISQLGQNKFDSITPNSLDFGDLYKLNKVHLLFGNEIEVDNDYAIVHNIVNAGENNFSIQWDFFMSEKIGFDDMKHN